MARPKGAGRKKTAIKASDVQAFAGLGLTIEQVAGNLGVHPSTLYDKFKEDPALRDAFDIGRSKSICMVANKLYERAMNGDMTAIIFWLKSVGKWKDTNHVELTGANEGPIQIEDVRAKVLAKLAELGAGHGYSENKESSADDESEGAGSST